MDATHLTTTEKVVEAVLAYYRLADSFPATITEALAWYDTLPPDVQQLIGILPPHEWLSFPDFKRYLLEKRGLFLHAYMTTHLAPREVSHWLLHGDGGIGEGGAYIAAGPWASPTKKPSLTYGREGFGMWARTNPWTAAGLFVV